MLSKSKTILIVDDSVIILDRLALILKRFGNKGPVFFVRSCGDALHVLNTEAIDIAIFDIHLQDHSGIDLLRIVTGQYPDIPVIMLTNQSGKQVETTCLNMGAKYFLDKSKDFSRIPQIIASFS